MLSACYKDGHGFRLNLGLVYDKTLQQTFHQDYDVNLAGEGSRKDPESQEASKGGASILMLFEGEWKAYYSMLILHIADWV